MTEKVLSELFKHVSPGARTPWVDLASALPQVAAALELGLEEVRQHIVRAAYQPEPPLRLYRSEQHRPELIVVGGVSYGYASLVTHS